MYIFDRAGVRGGGMSEKSDLMSWRVQNADTDLHAPRVRAHPLFPKAARALCANSLAAGNSGKALAGIMKDAGRYVAAMWAIYLHVSGGLTLPRLKEICVSSGFLSPGRARAMLLYMRYLGYVVPVPDRIRGEPQLYVPTASFRQAWREHLRWALQAALIIEPGIQTILDRLGDDAIFERITKFQAEGLLALARARDRETTHIRVFMHRHAGIQIMSTLLTAPGEAFPPEGPIAFSIAAAAQRFGVSRIHIRRMLNDAVREDFFSQANDGVVMMTEKAREELCTSYSMQFAQLLASAAEALAQAPASHAQTGETQTLAAAAS
jgi:hypothetical protein